MSEPAGVDRNFIFFELNRLAIVLAYNMQSIAIAWLVYEVTGRPLSLGLTGLMQFLPMALLFPFAGLVGDRYSRKWVLFACQIGFLLAAGALFFVSKTHITSVVPIYGILVAIGVMRAFSGPAVPTCLMDVVGENKYARVMPMHSMVFEIGTIVGPTLGGFVYDPARPSFVFAVAMVLFFVGLLSLAAAQTKFEVRAKAASEAGLATIWKGVQYVAKEKILLGAILLDLFAVFFGGVVNLMPVFARDVLHVGTRELGIMRSAPAAGAVLMALFLMLRPIQRKGGRALFVAVFIFGLATIVFARSGNLYLSLAMLAVLGAADMISVQIRMTTVQLATPPAMRGRVAAVNGLFIGASNELGEFESGATAELMGPRQAAAFGGLMTCGIVVVFAKLFPSLLKVDRFDELRPREDVDAQKGTSEPP